MRDAAEALSSLLHSRLDDGLLNMRLELESSKRLQLLHYVAMLNKWNKVYNLTAVREPERMVGLHILDSLSVLPYLSGIQSVIDVGTGGGLPGIPLAIAKPDLKVLMLDTVAKKTTFVRQVIAELGLKNAMIVTERVENHTPPTKFDRVISRAFAELKDFVESAAHLCAEGGRLLAMKGTYPHDEITRLPVGYAVEETFALNVPSVEGQRHLIVIRKI